MLSIILIACVLVAVTVAVHAAGISMLLKALRRGHPLAPTRFWPITRLLVLTTWCLKRARGEEVLSAIGCQVCVPPVVEPPVVVMYRATQAFINMFAGGAILVMLADTMIPEAFQHGGNLAGLINVMGFAVAVYFSLLS